MLWICFLFLTTTEANFTLYLKNKETIMPGIDFQDVYEIENGSLEAEILNIDVSNSNSHRDVKMFLFRLVLNSWVIY